MVSAVGEVARHATVVAWIQAIETRRAWTNVVLQQALIPLSVLFLTRYMLPPDQVAGARLAAGTIVFSVGIGSVTALSQTIAYDRLSHRLDLYVTSPMARLPTRSV